MRASWRTFLSKEVVALHMASKVYFIPISSHKGEKAINDSVKRLILGLIEAEDFKLSKRMPLKVHFGEKGNKTFIPASWMDGIIDLLEENKVDTSFMETNVLYRGERMLKTKHEKLALDHGFTRIPVEITDGKIGEDYVDVEINKNVFDKCKIAKGIVNEKGLIVVSHFKGHMLAGFGGAIKQLAMGCAARGGKLDQHVNSIPTINPLQCKRCGDCVRACPVNAIHLNIMSAKIDKKKCIGCAACIATCPHHAIKINWMAGIGKGFKERLAEYAYAAQLGKKNIYVTYAMNITKQCDCMGKDMKPFIDDLGIFASTDPLAIDVAALDMLDKREGKKVFKGRSVLDFAENVGLGSREYELVEMIK